MKISFSLLCGLAAATVCSASSVPNYWGPFRRDLGEELQQKLAPQLSGSAEILLDPEDAKFKEATGRYNAWRAPKSVAVVKAKTERDVEMTARFAVASGRKFLVQNTGHLWTDWSNATDLLLIKTTELKNIDVDVRRNTATVGPGAIFEDVINALYPLGKQVPTGTCNCVGMIGATLGGGHGRLQGLHGLTLDNLLSAKVVLASGKTVTVSAKQNSDLFWALRGAGQNFGVVLSATYRIYDAVNDGNHYNMVHLFEGKDLEAVFKATNSFVIPAAGSIYILYYYDAEVEKPVVMLDWVYAGPEAEGAAIYKKIYGHLDQFSIKKTEQVIPWSEINIKTAGGLPVAFCIRGQMVNVFSTGVRQYHLGDMREIWNNWVEFRDKNPKFTQTLYLFESYPLQQFRNLDWSSTAYPNRDVNHIIVPIVMYPGPDEDPIAQAFIDENKPILERNRGYRNNRVYINYARGNEDYREMLGFEQWRLQNLKNIKAKYDPKGKFSNFLPLDKIPVTGGVLP